MGAYRLLARNNDGTHFFIVFHEEDLPDGFGNDIFNNDRHTGTTVESIDFYSESDTERA